ncbi:HAD-IA family hydrolase [Mycolicibacterium komossense]|uniref:HAD-IA family hydrolase n=1 Tax=Mycolicibacterium komossense TaxID=1779 RepID=A0ABT3C6N1_9MYCO|nr:HAD-IA family hydrolase [Mycolicibacterium komossense]MCV7225110.1 HAD-IA family hydrolase [Mycolicibacterium komossense]
MTAALILDCDGVLAETELDGHLVAFNRAFDELGFGFHWTADEYDPLLKVGGGKERLRAFLQQNPEIDLGSGAELDANILAAHKLKSSIYVDLVQDGALPARPGIARLVREALDDGWQVACASTSAERSVEAVLNTILGPDQRARMAGVFAGDIVDAKKPAPDIYLLTAQEIGRSADEVVVIEDSQSGAAAAAAAGMAHLVTVSHFTAQDSFPAATTVVDHLGESDRPATVRAGVDVRNTRGFVDLDGIAAVLAAHSDSVTR